ncbi:MAG: permease of phosphate ABC transporter [Oscillibacter sp.]|nr:permease of phosphate ABC transporter [Oscillibacter sp.]MBQ7778846.1 permease of phosphate ABC transporter [Oscillibacter sp.]
MRGLLEAVDLYLKDCGWKDLALFKFCVCAVGVLVGLAMPWRRKWTVAWIASLVFVTTYVPLMGKFLPYVLGDKIAIEDIYN